MAKSEEPFAACWTRMSRVGRNAFAGLLIYDCYTNMATSLFDREERLRIGLDLEFAAFAYPSTGSG